MKKIDEKRKQLLLELDDEYDRIRIELNSGYAAEQFNKKGQRTQNAFLGQFKVKVEAVQDLNRIERLLKDQ